MTRVFVPVIVGPTASGKSALALAVAQRCNGEIVSADAMAVYQGMDIGTAKPTAAERALVPHHLVGCWPCDDKSDAQRWVTAADAAVREISARGRLPIVAGGTPLYVKLLLEGISAGAPRDAQVRERLQQRYRDEGPAVLFAELQHADPIYAAQRHPNDERRVVRALEVIAITGKAYSSFHTTDGIRRADLRPLLIGLQWPRDELYRRIDARTARMFAQGLPDEVQRLAATLSAEARQAVGYHEILDAWMDRSAPPTAEQLAEAQQRTAQHSRNLAKHQLTWYRRWTDITWLPGDAPDAVDQAVALIDAARADAQANSL
jgi:tRNA dimethylallyltransferase